MRDGSGHPARDDAMVQDENLHENFNKVLTSRMGLKFALLLIKGRSLKCENKLRYDTTKEVND